MMVGIVRLSGPLYVVGFPMIQAPIPLSFYSEKLNKKRKCTVKLIRCDEGETIKRSLLSKCV